MVFLPSTRYGSFSVETSYHPSRSLFSATYFPQSDIRPFSFTTFAPNAWHSITFAAAALAAYAPAAGNPAVIAMPAATPFANGVECQASCAKAVTLNGLLSEWGKSVATNKDR